MTPLDILPWEGMGGYGIGYPTKYITPFRGVVAVISSSYLIIKNINLLKIDVSINLIIVISSVTLKIYNIYYLFNKRVASLDDIIINNNVSKYELSIDKNNKNNIDLSIIISEEKDEQ